MLYAAEFEMGSQLLNLKKLSTIMQQYYRICIVTINMVKNNIYYVWLVLEFSCATLAKSLKDPEFSSATLALRKL